MKFSRLLAAPTSTLTNASGQQLTAHVAPNENVEYVEREELKQLLNSVKGLLNLFCDYEFGFSSFQFSRTFRGKKPC